MHARRRVSCALAAIALVLCTFAVGGCGEEASEPPAERDPTWSDPAVDGDYGSPDGGSADGVTSAETLLERLRRRVAEGTGHADPSFERQVGDVAAVLWSDEAEGPALEAARVHTQVVNIAGEVGRWLATSESARAERTKSHPTDVALYDAFLRAAARGPQAYRAWCAAQGARLLREHADAQYRKHFPPR